MTPVFPPSIQDLMPWDNLQDYINDWTKGLQELADALSPDDDNQHRTFVPHNWINTLACTRLMVNQVTTEYNDFIHSWGQQTYMYTCNIQIDNNVATIGSWTNVGKCAENAWSNFSAEQREEIAELFDAWDLANDIVFRDLFPAEFLELQLDYFDAYSQRLAISNVGRNPQDSFVMDVTDVIGTANITPIKLWFYPQEFTTTTIDPMGEFISMVGRQIADQHKIVTGIFDCPYQQPLIWCTSDEDAVQKYVTVNGSDHNYTTTYNTGDGDEFKVYYGDNYTIYVVPDGDKISYDDVYNVTKNVVVPQIDPTIHVKTYEENKYGPQPPDSDEDDIDEQDMGVGSNLGGLGGYWLLTKEQLADLHGALNSAPVGFDPLNSFISLMGLGVDVTKVLDGTEIQFITPINIRMSDGTTWSTHVEAHSIGNNEIVSAFNSDTFRIQRKYNNFLDYSPYATHELFIPMCGWVTLPDIAVDREIYVTYIPDIESCKCRAVVSVVSNSEDDDGNGCVIAEKDGIMGADVPFSNVGHSLFVGDAIINGANIAGEAVTMAIGASFMKTGASGKTFKPYEGFTLGGAGTLPGAIGNAFVSGNLNRTHFMTGNSVKTGFSDGESIIVKSVYHIPDIPENYAHTVGLVCNKTGQLTEFNGFTICDNPHITFSALEAEKEEIKRLLEEGVILPSGE